MLNVNDDTAQGKVMGMQRRRDESRWEFTRHKSVAHFLEATPQPGAHSIQVGSQLLDLLIEDRGSNTTLVVFHSALTNHVRTLPVLQGHGMAETAVANLVSVSDPSLAMGDVDLSWFIGNRAIGSLRPHLSPLIHHAVSALGGSRVVLFGSSGGGYAAINFAQDFPDCMVLAINPRLNLRSRPHPRMAEYLRACHNAESRTPMLRIRHAFVTENIADSIRGKLTYDLLLFQNTGDPFYLNDQARPFIASLSGDPRLHVRMEHTGRGHVPLSRVMLDEILHELSAETDTQVAIKSAGFESPYQETEPRK